MKITVVLCTYNRCLSLAKALESASALRLPSSTEWEVLIVDNNSSDGTREVAEEFCRSFPGHFRYLFEPQPGKSHALNSGIRNTTADVVAFMDDDVTVEPTWLQQLTDPLHGGSWAGSGGRIVPDQQFVPPRWLSLDERYALALLAMFDYGPGSCGAGGSALRHQHGLSPGNLCKARRVPHRFGSTPWQRDSKRRHRIWPPPARRRR